MMGSLNSKKTVRNLLSKGFVKARGDHQFLEFWHNGRYVLQTFCSHNSQDINDHLIIMMKNQCRLDKGDFLDLANCPLSREGYVSKLVERGMIKKEDLSMATKIE
jgi:predicted RNA binding protein YcfA (HicA-like mRNA interferase family)